MGSCCSKEMANSDEYGAAAGAVASTARAAEPRPSTSKMVDPRVIDVLVLELLDLIASFVDNDEESPVSLVKLHLIAEREEGWFQVITSMVQIIPLENPLGPSAITIVFDDCPLPSKEQVIKLQQMFGLSAMRALSGDINVQYERNICVVLGCVADKLAGPNSVAVLTEETLDYMLSFLMFRREPRIVLFALIALEKFAHTTENKLTIKDRLDKEEDNPLILLEAHASSDDYTWRQVGFCARWALDNIFTVVGRPLSYELVDMSNVNAVMNLNDVSEYLKMGSDGLEARCDSYSFESVRCTFQVNSGAWYYECTIITPGVMQIGWATKNSHFLNHEGYGIGDDLYSLSYDGCRKLLWHEAKPSPVHEVEGWQPGDIVGCLIDMEAEEAIFSLNGRRIRTCTNLFETSRKGFYAAASFMAFQQCRFNFGTQAFRFPPADREFKNFNAHGELTPEQKKIEQRDEAEITNDYGGTAIEQQDMPEILSSNGESAIEQQDLPDLMLDIAEAANNPYTHIPDDDCRAEAHEAEPPSDRRILLDQRRMVPRRMKLAVILSAAPNERACSLCCDAEATCVLEPCLHRGFCSLCTAQLKECPMCRAPILRVRMEPL